MTNGEIHAEICIAFAYDESKVSWSDASKSVAVALCDAGNGIIGDDVDGNGTKIQVVSLS